MEIDMPKLSRGNIEAKACPWYWQNGTCTTDWFSDLSLQDTNYKIIKVGLQKTNHCFESMMLTIFAASTHDRVLLLSLLVVTSFAGISIQSQVWTMHEFTTNLRKFHGVWNLFQDVSHFGNNVTWRVKRINPLNFP